MIVLLVSNVSSSIICNTLTTICWKAIQIVLVKDCRYCHLSFPLHFQSRKQQAPRCFEQEQKEAQQAKDE